jgi:hypothetical protein
MKIQHITNNEVENKKYNNDILVQFPAVWRLGFIFVGFFFSSIFRIDDTIPFLYFPVLLIALCIYVSILFLPKILLIYPLFILILVMPDLTQSSNELDVLGVIKSANLWQFSIGLFTPSTFISLMLLIILIRLYSKSTINIFNTSFIYFAFLMPLISIYFGFLQNSFSRFFSDFKIVIFFFLGINIFQSYYKRFSGELWKTTQTFIYLAIGNFLVDVIKYLFFSNNTTLSQSYYNLSMDSGKGIILIFFFYSLLNLQKRKNILFNFVIILSVILLLFLYQTRWLLVVLILGLLILVLFIGLIKYIKFGIVIIIFSIIIISFLNSINLESWEIMKLRFDFIENIGQGNNLTDLDFTRGGTIINSMSTVYEKKAILTGLSYGSWYTDAYFPMLNLTTAAFEEDSINKGQFFRVHDFLFHFIFKFGIIGLVIYTTIFFKPMFEVWKVKKHLLKKTFDQTILLTYLGILPMVLTFMYSTGKGLLFSALFIVSFQQWIDYFKRANNLVNE